LFVCNPMLDLSAHLWMLAESQALIRSSGLPSTNKKKEKEDKWPTTQERESWPSSFSLFVAADPPVEASFLLFHF